MVNRMLKRTFAFLTLVGALLAFSPMSDAEAAIVAKVDLARQRMDVYVDGALKHSWPVSTGRKGWETRPGTYYPFALTRRFYSSKWKMNLPYLVSIGQDGTAIHGTDYAGKLGRPASHGCIRLHPDNAEEFFELVKAFGPQNTEIVIVR